MASLNYERPPAAATNTHANVVLASYPYATISTNPKHIIEPLWITGLTIDALEGFDISTSASPSRHGHFTTRSSCRASKHDLGVRTHQRDGYFTVSTGYQTIRRGAHRSRAVDYLSLDILRDTILASAPEHIGLCSLHAGRRRCLGSSGEARKACAGDALWIKAGTQSSEGEECQIVRKVKRQHLKGRIAE